MHSRISVTNNNDNSLVSIRPPDGRIISLIVLFGLLWLAATDNELIHISHFSRNSFHIFPVALFLFVLMFNIWQFFGKEVIGIYDHEIRITKMIGFIRVGKSKSIPTALIDAISVQENKYRSRGHYSALSRIIFLSNGKEVGCSSQFSAADSEILLNGPFKKFKR
jgi:hypothetical protein